MTKSRALAYLSTPQNRPATQPFGSLKARTIFQTGQMALLKHAVNAPSFQLCRRGGW